MRINKHFNNIVQDSFKDKRRPTKISLSYNKREIKQIVARAFGNEVSPGSAERKVWYNIKRPRNIIKIHRLSQALIKNYEYVYFITTTTNQSRTGLSDGALLRVTTTALRNQGLTYIGTVERQNKGQGGKFRQPTEDLHFHFIVGSNTPLYQSRDDLRYFCIQQIQGFARIYECSPHPSLFDIKQIRHESSKKIISYITKYITKQESHCNPLFKCRTLFYSQILAVFYKKIAHRFERQIDEQKLLEFGVELQVKQKKEFATVYDFSKEAWLLAGKFNRKEVKS